MAQIIIDEGAAAATPATGKVTIYAKTDGLVYAKDDAGTETLAANATHTGDATGATALTVVGLNGTNLASLGTGVLKNTTATGVPFISKVALTEPATSSTLTIADGQTLTVNGSATITNGTHSGTNTGDQTSVSGNAGTVTIGDAGGDTTTWVLLGTSQTGNMSPSTDAGITYNATTNILTAGGFAGDLTGNVTGNVSGSSGSCTGNAATVTTNANLTGHVTSVGNAAVLGSFTIAQLNTAISDADAATLAGSETLTNKRITKRVVSMSDATSFTPTADTADINTQTNTQAGGTLTANAPSGTPTDGQPLILRIKCTNAQTMSWNAIYRGSVDLALTTSTSGSSKTDLFMFIYNSADTKWDFAAKNLGY